MVKYSAIAVSVLSVTPLALAIPKPWDLGRIIRRDDDGNSIGGNDGNSVGGNDDWNSGQVHAAPAVPAVNNFQGNHHDVDSVNGDNDDWNSGQSHAAPAVPAVNNFQGNHHDGDSINGDNDDWNSGQSHAAPAAPAVSNVQGNHYDADSFVDYEDSFLGDQAENERKRKNLVTAFGTCDRKCHSDLLGVLKFNENTCRVGLIRRDLDDDNSVNDDGDSHHFAGNHLAGDDGDSNHWAGDDDDSIHFAGDDGKSLHFDGDDADSLFFGNNDRAVDLKDYYEMDLRISSCLRCLEGQDTKDNKKIDQLKKFNRVCIEPRVPKL